MRAGRSTSDPSTLLKLGKDILAAGVRLGAEDLILQSHPLSPVPAKVVRVSQSEVVGQVVGVAMRLGEWRSIPGAELAPKERAALN